MIAPSDSNFEPEWRSKPFQDRLAFAYTNKLFTDVTICAHFVGEIHRFMAHKNILAYYSSVLQEQLFNKYPHLAVVQVTGIDPQGLEYVLKELYHVPQISRKETDRCILVSAYHAAMKLGICHIEADLKRHIMEHIPTRSLLYKDDFWKILELTRILKLDEVTNRLMKFAECNGKRVLRAKSLIKASPSTLKQVLDFENLKVPESDVLDSIVRWKEENSTLPFLDDFVKDLMGCVRFRNLTSLELCQFIATKADLISSDDVLGIMMHLGNPVAIPLPAWCSTKFRCFTASPSEDSLASHQNKGSSNLVHDCKAVSSRITQQDETGLLNMYIEEKNADVCFLVGDNRVSLKAHRNILSLGSTVFEKMFFGDCADSRYEIEVPTEDPEGFEKMLIYFYDDSDPDSLFKMSDVAAKTYNASLKYGSANLRDVCLKHHFPDTMKPGAFWLELGAKIRPPFINNKSLKILLDYASRNSKDVLECPGFMNVTVDAIKCVLQLNNLSVKEIDILKKVVKWLEKNSRFCNSEESRYELLRLVRFSYISAEEFCSFMEKHDNFLPKDESLAIFMHLQNKNLPLPLWCYRGPQRTVSHVSYDKCPFQRDGCFRFPPAMERLGLSKEQN